MILLDPRRSFVLFAALLALPRLLPAAPYAPPSSDPQELYTFQGHVYFSADDGIHGRELWRSTARGEIALVADITPGSESSTISDFADFGHHLLFRLDPAVGGSELWRTDGTAAGTTRIAQFDAEQGLHFDGVIGATPDGRAWLRIAAGSTHLWVTDGTPEGTQLCALRLPDGPEIAIDYSIILQGGYLYFGGLHPADGPGLFRYNTDGGIVERVAALGSPDTEFLPWDGERFLFRGAPVGYGLELMISDGTSEGTRLVADIAPGPAPSYPNEFTTIGSFFSPRTAPPNRFELVSNENGTKLAVFSADDGTHGIEPWITDGTGEGTRLLADVYPGKESSGAYNYKVYGDRITFPARGEGMGRELWFTTQPYETVALLADLYPGPTGSEPYSIFPLIENDTVFSALDPNYGEELFLARATSREARLQKDIYPGPDSSYPYWSVALDGRVIFAATDPIHGRELWYIDQQGEVALLADVYTDASVNPSSSPEQLTPVGDLLYFVCNDIEHGAELWISDGGSDGTRLLKDIFPGPGSSAPQSLSPLGTIVYFTAEDGGGAVRLWRTDGTAGGTAPVDTEAQSPLHLTVRESTLFFSATRAEAGRELWIVGPDRPAELVRDIAPGPTSSNPRNLVVFKEGIYFLADDGVHGEELWRSDGTTAGTVMVRDIVPVPFEKLSYQTITPTAAGLYLAAGSGTRGLELWRYVPGDTRPTSVKDIATWDSATQPRPGQSDAKREGGL
ncbi:MAG: hypothetical protein JNK74_05915 [Candidatus Hydrogenedentes bacterium]|nr:hypothetical protein [Candidatus Hydrogenedentota bacterium]